MAVIKPTCIQDLKLRVNIVDVISRTVTLRKAGGRFKGLCPFHNEKTPSFHVDPDKGFFKCFGCGKAGDIISFVRETEQLNFTEAVETLGQRFGVPIEYEEGRGGPTREERSLRQELFEIHDLATEHYHSTFRNLSPLGDFMRTYWLEQRRFGMEIAEEFKIGAAAPADDGLAALLFKRQFSEEALRQCGLFFIREDALLTLGALRPRFRGRLMIPIRDHQGRVVAFTARQTEFTPQDDPAREAKYVNSPETPIFTKGNLLFNLDRARTAVGDKQPFVLVEGQLDAIRCWSVGLKAAIAPQGTSITDSQLILLRRYAQQVECFFDSDGAGQKAALRFLPMALKAGLEVRFLTLAGAGKIDPDLLFLERGLAAYADLQAHAHTAMAFACRSLVPSPATASIEEKSRAIKVILDLIEHAESQVIRAAYVEEVAQHLRVGKDELHRDTRVQEGQAVVGKKAEASTPLGHSIATPGNIPPEQNLLWLLLHCDALAKPLSRACPPDWIDLQHPAGLLLHRFLGEIEHDNWPGRDHLESLLETPEERTLVASLLFDAPRSEDPLRHAIQGLQQLRARALEPRLRKIELDLATLRADSEGDALSLIKQRTELQRQLRQPLGLPGVD